MALLSIKFINQLKIKILQITFQHQTLYTLSGKQQSNYLFCEILSRHFKDESFFFVKDVLKQKNAFLHLLNVSHTLSTFICYKIKKNQVQCFCAEKKLKINGSIHL